MDEGVMIVGVPGMGNSEPSWHQRQPFGFSRTGRGRAQAGIQTLRRPSTGYARLGGGEDVDIPIALSANRVSCWGNSGNSRGVNGEQGRTDGLKDFTLRGLPTDSFAARRTLTETSTRQRPATAGHQRAPALLPDGEANGQTTPNSALSAHATACIRNRAGIVRNGRDGRPAPPPTPPPPTPPPQSRASVTQAQLPMPCRPAEHHSCRRRPSTAGAARPTVTHFETPFGLPRAADDSMRGKSIAPRHGVEVGTRASSSVPQTGSKDIGGGGPRRGGSLNWENGTPNTTAAGTRKTANEGNCAMDNDDGRLPAPATTTSAAAVTPRSIPEPQHQQQCTTAGERTFAEAETCGVQGFYEETSGDIHSHGATNMPVQGQRFARRRQASAAQPRSRSDARIDGFVIDNFGGEEWAERDVNRSNTGGFGRGTAWDVGDRGRRENRDQRTRPKSASAAGTHLRAEQDPWRRDAGRSRRSSSVSRCTFNGVPPRDLDQPRWPPPVVPDFVVSEKQVLRFFGHLSEELAWGTAYSSSEDTPRALKIRQVVLSLFLADGSLEIFETRQQNSGEQGGLLVKRNMFKKRDGSFYGFRDLKVGTDLKLLGKSFRLTGCDDYTRNWYSNKGFVMPEAEAVPEQVKECLRVEHTTGLSNPLRPRTAGSRPSTAGRSTAESYGRQARQAKARRFYKHDKQVLRFKAVWDDPSKGGMKRWYYLLFYLQDETVSLLNPREEQRNSGRDEGAVYVRRQRLPKHWRCSDTQYESERDSDDNHVQELDLIVGGTVCVWGRKMRLVGCDPFTKDYYRREHGMEMESNTAAAAQRTKKKESRMYLWPSTAYRQQRQFCRQMSQGRRRSMSEDAKKRRERRNLTAMDESCAGERRTGTGGALPPDRFKGRRIRCKAVLNSSHPNDVGREFVITYDLGWDTIMVYELQRRNSGRPGGLFLMKGRHRRPAKSGTGSYYVPQDIFLGAEVPLATGHTLLVTEMDRSSLLLCEEFPHEFPLMDCERILGRVANRARQMDLDLRGELRHRAEKAWARSIASALSSTNGSSAPRASPSVRPPPAAMAMLSGWTAGKGFTGGGVTKRHGNRNGTSNNYNSDSTTSGKGETAIKDAGVEGRRARIGATWGLVGGWGDCPSDVGKEDRMGREGRDRVTYAKAYLKNGFSSSNSGVAPPWATVAGASHTVSANPMARGRTEWGDGVAGEAGQSTAGSFEDEGAFRDAMDELGLFVGLGAQEVLTLVRTFVDRRFEGRRVLWANMCDRISQISALGQGQCTRKEMDLGPQLQGATAGRGRSQTGQRASDHQLAERMRERDVAWRAIFAAKEVFLRSNNRHVSPAVTRSRSGETASHFNGILGVASLVQVLRRHGVEVSAGDASFLARRFNRGGGSQVDYNLLCDAVYPCNFAEETSNTRDANHDDDNMSGHDDPMTPRTGGGFEGTDRGTMDGRGKGQPAWSLWDRDDHGYIHGRSSRQDDIIEGSQCWDEEDRDEQQWECL